MQALFIGHTYIDVTFVADAIPTGDAKAIAQDYAVAFGGNAVTAAFCCAKLGVTPDLLCTISDDWLGRMFMDMAQQYRIPVHARKVRRASLSFVMPKGGKRAILRMRDDEFIHPFPPLNIDGCRALHVDGHQADAALHYAKVCREAGILTSLDGGAVREDTEELLAYIDVAVVSERFCEQWEKSPEETVRALRQKGCKVAAVTLGERGMLWCEEGEDLQTLPALAVPPSAVIDTNGAGDIFHGAYVYAYLANPDGRWADHFRFARGASAHAVQHLGNEAKLPSLEDIKAAQAKFAEA